MGKVSYIYVPIETVTRPARSGPHNHYKDHYWQHVPDHGLVLAQVGSRKALAPQANPDRSIVEHITSTLNATHPAPVEVIHLEHAFLPIDQDGQHKDPRR